MDGIWASRGEGCVVYLHGLSGLQRQIVEIDVIHLWQEGTHNIEECSVRQACNGCESNLFNLG